MAQSVIFRSQFLTIFVERCPRCLQPVFDLLCFLIFERDFLSKISRTFSFCQDFNFDVVNRDFFRLHSVLVTEYFRLVRVVLNSHNISRSFSSDVEKRSTSSANLRFVRQSSVLSLSLIPFLFSCHCFRLFSNEYCNTVLKSNEDSGSPCLVPLLIGNTSLSSSVKTVPSSCLYSRCSNLTYAGLIP